MKKQILFFILLLFSFCIQAQEHAVEILNSQNDNVFIVSAKNNSNIQQEVTLTLEVKHMRGYTKPITKLVQSKDTLELVQLKPIPGKKATYTANYRYVPKPTDAEIALQDEKLKAKTVSSVEDMNNGIVLFYQDGCPRCHYVTNYMLNNDIDFSLFNTTGDTESDKLMWKILKEANPTLGSVKMPVVLVNGKVSYNIKDLKSFTLDALKVN